jgi:hypothetical protein
MPMRIELWLSCLLMGCSTLADSGGGDDNLPNAQNGPFREIEQAELGNGRVAPYALRDNDDFPRDVGIVARDQDAGSFAIWAYAARTAPLPDTDPDPGAPATAIVRHEALDGRSLDRAPVTVLEATQPWEGGTVGAPSPLRVDGEIWLFYAGADGIGLATSSDGASFTRVGDAPILTAVAGGWETGPPASPGAIRLEDGSFQLFYEAPSVAGAAIGLATSPDGVSWVRSGDAPVIAAGDGVDAAGARAPWSIFADTAEGRRLQLVYYGALADDGRATIGMAAREGTTGPFQRAAGPVFGTSGSLGPGEPCVMRYDAFTLLFVTQKAGTSSAQQYPAVAVGVAPATAGLPSPDPK